MKKCSGKAFSEVWTMFSSAQKAKGVSDITLRNYRQHLHNISKHFDIEMPFDELSKSKFEDMIVSMRDAGLAHNSIATYVRVLRTFLNWCNKEGLCSISLA